MIELKNRNDIKIENLRNIVREKLNRHIDGDYVLLDIPNHRNIGDTLIWQGELEYLKEFPFKMKYCSNIYTYLSKKILNNEIIFFHGGGNFGDVWRLNQDFRNNVIKEFPNNKIIFFPQTIHYDNLDNLEIDKNIINAHKNIVLCARDEVSYNIAKDNFHNANVYLVPDMAFFNDFSNEITTTKTNKVLFLKRKDKELRSEDLLNKTKENIHNNGLTIEENDWPGFYSRDEKGRYLQMIYNILEIKLSSKMIKIPILNLLVDDVHGLRPRNYKDKLISSGINFINQYDVVYSTRLHGFILAVLLNKEVYIFDNSYGKNKNFFNTWLSDFDNVKLIKE